MVNKDFYLTWSYNFEKMFLEVSLGFANGFFLKSLEEVSHKASKVYEKLLLNQEQEIISVSRVVSFL